ncbi:MAG: DUF3352 domain-containing protein [Vulcanimicrobiota bacterium]
MLAVIVLAGGFFAYRWFSKPAGGLDPVLALVPAEAELVAATSLEGQVDLVTMARDLVAMAEQLPDYKADQVEAELGAKPEEFASWFDPVGYFAVLAPNGGKGLLPAQQQVEVDAIVALRLREPELVKAWIEKKAGETPAQAVEGVDFRFTTDNAGYAIENGWLLMVSSQRAAAASIKTMRGGPNVTSKPRFQEARQKLSEDNPDTFVFLNLSETLVGLCELPQAAGVVDSQSSEGLKALLYTAYAGNWSDGTAYGLLRVDETSQAPLAKALLAKPGIQGRSAQLVSADAQTYAVFGLNYGYHLLLEVARLNTQVRGQVGMASFGVSSVLGVDPEKGLWEILDGELAYSSDFLDSMWASFAGGFGGARAQGQYTACKSNLKNIATACEMYSTDWSGRYPTELALLTPNYLKTIPSCPAAQKDTYTGTYQMGTSPDSYRFACEGNHHSEVASEDPYYTSDQGLMAEAGSSTPAPASRFTAMVYVPGKDKAKIEGLLDKVMGQAGRKPPTRQVGEHEVYSFTGQDLVTVIDKPLPCLIVGFGDKSDEMFQTAVSGGSSLADDELVKSGLKWAGDDLLSLQFINFGPFFDKLEKSIGDHPAATLVKQHPQGRGVTVAAVRADGIYTRSEGAELMKLAGVAGIGAAILVPNFIKARGQGQSTACKSNLKNIGTACEMYSTDYSGRYPQDLNTLTPNYLRMIPTCPSAGEDTYSQSYQMATDPDMYTFFCSGHHHQELPPNRPLYNGMTGLETQ